MCESVPPFATVTSIWEIHVFCKCRCLQPFIPRALSRRKHGFDSRRRANDFNTLVKIAMVGRTAYGKSTAYMPPFQCNGDHFRPMRSCESDQARARRRPTR